MPLGSGKAIIGSMITRPKVAGPEAGDKVIPTHFEETLREVRQEHILRLLGEGTDKPLLDIHGVKLSVPQWCEVVTISPATIKSRVKEWGVTMVDAVLMNYHCRKKTRNEYLEAQIKDLAERLSLD